MHIETRTVPISDEVSLVVETVGEGPPLVLLPSGGCSTRAYHPLIGPLVERGLSVTAINPRGTAGSTGSLDGLTLHDLAADVAGLITTLDLASTHIVGWAFGNRVARCVAADVPDVVESVVLLAAGGQATPDPEAWAALARIGNVEVSHDKRLSDLSVAFFAAASDPALGDWLDIGFWPEARAAQQQANHATPLEDWWAGGARPLLVIQGLEDRIAPPANGHALREEFGDRVRVVDLPDAGHGLAVEQPEAIAEAIDGWVREGWGGR